MFVLSQHLASFRLLVYRFALVAFFKKMSTSSLDSTTTATSSGTSSPQAADSSAAEIVPIVYSSSLFPLTASDFASDEAAGKIANIAAYTEKGYWHRYSLRSCGWECSHTQVVIEPKPFARGAMRLAYKCILLTPGSPPAIYVAKRYKKESVKRDQYFADAHMHTVANHWAEIYNRYSPPKLVSFLDATVLELSTRRQRLIFCLEPFLPGEYKKFNNNNGYVSSSAARCTPQTFSHVTYHFSGGAVMVTDIQGVGNIFTDPQIHSLDGKEYGRGNLGERGMRKFLDSHTCTQLCAFFNLPRLEKKSKRPEKSKASAHKHHDAEVVSREQQDVVPPLAMAAPSVASPPRQSAVEAASPSAIKPSLLRRIISAFKGEKGQKGDKRASISRDTPPTTPLRAQAARPEQAEVVKEAWSPPAALESQAHVLLAASDAAPVGNPLDREDEDVAFEIASRRGVKQAASRQRKTSPPANRQAAQPLESLEDPEEIGPVSHLRHFLRATNACARPRSPTPE
jgi:hypothetical protein